MAGITIHRTKLQDMKADALAYGAKDTGDMGGGAAAAISLAAGEKLKAAARLELSKSTRQLGDAVITESFGLAPLGVKWVVHVISIVKHTTDGAWCPKPEKLHDGVRKGLQLAAAKGAQTFAISMLATGEGRVKPADAARIMVGAIRSFHREGGQLDVMFALPSPRDHDAVQQYLRMNP
jgi:O-acetyl-ADP-ribose deacetylase (regulator of RNase III)